MYKAVFLDMDGTLLRKDHSVSEETKVVIDQLSKGGVPVTLVSARPLHAIMPTFYRLGLPEHAPLVSLNGSYIVEAGEPIFQSAIDLETTEAVARQVRPYGATITYYLQQEWFSETKDRWTDHEQRITDVPLRVAALPELISEWSERGISPNKMMIMSEAEAIAQTQTDLKNIYGGRLNIYPSKPTFLEVMEPSGSKSNAVKFLIDRMNLDRTEIIAMGDNYNDQEMLEFAGMGVAMGNAPEAIKAVAGYVTDTNNNDGVRLALEKFFDL